MRELSADFSLGKGEEQLLKASFNVGCSFCVFLRDAIIANDSKFTGRGYWGDPELDIRSSYSYIVEIHIRLIIRLLDESTSKTI